MKVGLSLSRCMRDIVAEKVPYDEVLVVIARTNVDPHNDNQWRQLADGYFYGGLSYPEWMGMEEQEEQLRTVLKKLHDDGRLHQPRQFGAHPPRLRYYWLECFAPEEEIATNPATQKAWETYKLLAGL